MERAGGWSFVQAFLASPGLAILTATKRHAAVASQMIHELPHLAGSIFHDVHTPVLMREHGVARIVTHDTDFHRFPFIGVVDPVTVA